MERKASLGRPLLSTRAAFFAGTLLSLLSGGLLLLALPPHNLGILAWIAFTPGLLAQFLLAPDDRAACLYQALQYTVGIGLAAFLAFPLDLLPGPNPVTLLVVAAGLLVGGVVFVLGLPTGTPSFHRRTRFRYFVIGPAVAWTGFEFLRMRLQLGHIWGLLATSQDESSPALQLVALGGPWLLSLLIVAANYALGLGAIMLLSPRDRKAGRRPALLTLLLLAPLLTAAFAWGAMRNLPHIGEVSVAAIQPGKELAQVPRYVTLWSVRDWEGLAQEVVPDMAALTREAAARGAELIVWPEAVLWLDPQSDPWARDELADLAQETGASLIVPYFVLTPQGHLSWWLGRAPRMRNEAILITPQGEFQGPYAKDHPIPYIGERSSTRGVYPVYSLPLGHVGTMLGYDTAFTDTARRLVRRGAQLLTLSTHDWTRMSATYGRHTLLRAVENGVPIVKADWQVGSLIVDAQGQILAAAPSDRALQAVVLAKVPLGQARPTLYARLGDLGGYACLVGMVLFVAAVRLPWAGLARLFRKGA